MRMEELLRVMIETEVLNDFKAAHTSFEQSAAQVKLMCTNASAAAKRLKSDVEKKVKEKDNAANQATAAVAAAAVTIVSKRAKEAAQKVEQDAKEPRKIFTVDWSQLPSSANLKGFETTADAITDLMLPVSLNIADKVQEWSEEPATQVMLCSYAAAYKEDAAPGEPREPL